MERRAPGSLVQELADEDIGTLGRLRSNGEFEIGRLMECDLIVADASVSNTTRG
ncbi:MAG: hypothetical protein IRZ16_11985 [Myxococcaceae bacterium]|nr:hypothetical protein [Myxococcaceae bacterium]